MKKMLSGVLAALLIVVPCAAGDEMAVANLRAVAKAAGYLRWFSPADEGVGADWGEVIAAAVVRCEGASSGAALARGLEASFGAVAPEARFFTGEDARPKQTVREDEAGVWTAWVHHGLGREDEGRVIYRSERVRVDAPEVRESWPALRPGAMLSKELGRGVVLSWPLAREVQDGPQAPRLDGRTAGRGGADPQLPSADNAAVARAHRITDVIIAWNVFQHFYPYFDVVAVDWDSVLSESLLTAGRAGNERELLDVLRWMVTKLEDGHGLVQHASDPVTHAARLAWRIIDGKVVVTASGAAAEEGGRSAAPRAGDVVLSIDGEPAMRVWARRRALVAAATETSRDFKTGQSLLLGGPGTLELELEDSQGARRVVRVQREPKQEGIREVEAWIPPREMFRDLGEGIWYVDLDQASAEDLHRMMRTLSGARGLVLDMRGYPRRSFFALLSHLTDDPTAMPRTAVPAIHLPDRVGWRWEEQTLMTRPRPPRLTGNVAILIDGRVVSAAEHLLGAMEGAGVGTFVGEQTAGTNGNVNPIELPGGYRVVWTGLRVQKSDGSRHHGVGIVPQIVVAPTLQGVRAGRDEVLERGVEVVREGLR
jgi:hypothetical protein